MYSVTYQMSIGWAVHGCVKEFFCKNQFVVWLSLKSQNGKIWTDGFTPCTDRRFLERLKLNLSLKTLDLKPAKTNPSNVKNAWTQYLYLQTCGKTNCCQNLYRKILRKGASTGVCVCEGGMEAYYYISKKCSLSYVRECSRHFPAGPCSSSGFSWAVDRSRRPLSAPRPRDSDQIVLLF